MLAEPAEASAAAAALVPGLGGDSLLRLGDEVGDAEVVGAKEEYTSCNTPSKLLEFPLAVRLSRIVPEPFDSMIL